VGCGCVAAALVAVIVVVAVAVAMQRKHAYRCSGAFPDDSIAAIVSNRHTYQYLTRELERALPEPEWKRSWRDQAVWERVVTQDWRFQERVNKDRELLELLAQALRSPYCRTPSAVVRWKLEGDAEWGAPTSYYCDGCKAIYDELAPKFRTSRFPFALLP
jgi:hypothetical protein